MRAITGVRNLKTPATSESQINTLRPNTYIIHLLCPVYDGPSETLQERPLIHPLQNSEGPGHFRKEWLNQRSLV